MVSQPRRYGRGGLQGDVLSAEIAESEEQGWSSLVVFPFLAESVRQPCLVPHLHTDCQIVPLGM
jgi:hypothetical protein